MPKVIVLELPPDLELVEVLHALRHRDWLPSSGIRVYPATEATARNILHILNPDPEGSSGGPRV
jgi:hypothetical protein